MAVLLFLLGWPSKPRKRSAPTPFGAIHVMTALSTQMVLARRLMQFFSRWSSASALLEQCSETGATAASVDLLRWEKMEKEMVRSSGFEPPRYCYRQPLKLVRLPVPPRPHRGETSL